MYRYKEEMEQVKKKIISSILMVSILTSYLPSITNIEMISEVEAAAPQTAPEWWTRPRPWCNCRCL